jgi:hypothetical protein
MQPEPFFPGSLEKGEPKLLGSRCLSCGKQYFPKRDFCKACLGPLEGTPLGPEGELFAFSVAYAGPLAELVPYAFGHVLLKDGPKVFSLLKENDPKKLRIGMPVKLGTIQIQDPIDGERKTVYAFEPKG